MSLHFWLNGDEKLAPHAPMLLLDYLRNAQHQVGSKGACREGDCGACLILLSNELKTDNGKVPATETVLYTAQTSCLLRVQDVIGRQVITIEGVNLSQGLNPIQQILSENGASQCGFCSPGLVMGVVGWLLNGTTLSITEGEEWLNANLCRCTGYMGQRRSIEAIVNRFSDQLLNCTNRLQRLIEYQVLPPYALANKLDRLPTGPEKLPSSASHSTTIMGGGTDLNLQDAKSLSDASSILIQGEKGAVKIDEKGIWLSGRHPIQTISDALHGIEAVPSFSRFNHLFASVAVRNRATLGGNLAHGSPIADGITYLTALEALIVTNQRTFTIDQLMLGFKQTNLKEGEVIEWLVLPQHINIRFAHFDKVSRRGTTDIAAVNCAGCWELEDINPKNNRKIVKNVRLVIGGAAPVPVRLRDLEEALKGADLSLPLSQTLTQPLLDYVYPVLSPISDLRGTKEYRYLLAQQLILSQWATLVDYTDKGGFGS